MTLCLEKYAIEKHVDRKGFFLVSESGDLYLSPLIYNLPPGFCFGPIGL